MIIRQSNFQLITEGVDIINDGANRMFYTEVNEYFTDEPFRNFSIKIPLQGNLLYQTATKDILLTPGNYLLSHKQPGKLVIDSIKPIKSFCIDINQPTIAQALYELSDDGLDILEVIKASHFFSPDFFENVYALNSNPLGKLLSQVVHEILNENIYPDDETFLVLAKEVASLELNLVKSTGNISKRRSIVNQEMLRRLLKGKEYIDDIFLANPNILEIAKVAKIAEHHFMRSFKLAFGQSPYQYMMHKRLEHAKTLILKDHPYHAIAKDCGFPDIYTFNKAFKRTYSITPGQFKKTA